MFNCRNARTLKLHLAWCPKCDPQKDVVDTAFFMLPIFLLNSLKNFPLVSERGLSQQREVLVGRAPGCSFNPRGMSHVKGND
jgi:hypothetical protein